MKSKHIFERNLKFLTLWIISCLFLSVSAFRNQETTTPETSEEYTERTYRPILHSTSKKTPNISALKNLATIEENENEEEIISRAGCPVGTPSANEVTSTVPIVTFIAAFFIGVFWFIIFVILVEYFSEGQSSNFSNRSFGGDSLGNLIKNLGYLSTTDFNQLSDFVLSSISKLY